MSRGATKGTRGVIVVARINPDMLGLTAGTGGPIVRIRARKYRSFIRTSGSVPTHSNRLIASAIRRACFKHPRLSPRRLASLSVLAPASSSLYPPPPHHHLGDRSSRGGSPTSPYTASRPSPKGGITSYTPHSCSREGRAPKLTLPSPCTHTSEHTHPP